MNVKKTIVTIFVCIFTLLVSFTSGYIARSVTGDEKSIGDNPYNGEIDRIAELSGTLNIAERVRINNERSLLVAERERLVVERDGLDRDRERLERERAISTTDRIDLQEIIRLANETNKILEGR